MHPSQPVFVLVGGLVRSLPSSIKLTFVSQNRRDTDFRRRDGSVDMQALDQERDRLTAKYTAASLSFSSADNSSNTPAKRANTRFLDYDGKSLWTGSIQVGTPPRSYNVYYDTASTDLSLPFDREEDELQSIQYLVAGSAGNGILVRDTVTIGLSTVINQDVVAQEVIGSSVASRASDGVGLGFRDLSAARSYSFPFTLFQQTGSKTFSMLLSRIPGNSRLTFGVDRNIIGSNPVFYPVAKDPDSSWRTFWQIGQSTAFINGTQAWAGRDNFILDSGSSLIIAPPDAAAEFWSRFSGSRAEGSGYYSYACNNPPVVELSFGNSEQRFAINHEDFNIGSVANDATRCLGAVVGQDLNLYSSWVIGEAFFKSWLLIFDVSVPRIGIAKPKIL
ncbi:hypothetical protein JCM5353_008070 [Sporobolomyces roseus]